MRHEPDQAAPTNWITLVNDRCDLDLAFEALDGWDHFHTETIRGRIRSLQLRPKDAWEHFQKAGERSEEFGRSLRNLLRRFYLRVYRFENALIEDSTIDEARDVIQDPGSPKASGSRAEKLLKELLSSELPDSEIASQLRRFNQSLFLLHQESYAESRKILKRLIKDSRDRVGDEKAGFYLAAAVAHRGLEETEESDRQIENGGLYIPALDNTFNMGYYASILSALLRLWDRADEAQGWEDFILRLKIPKKTIELFRERSRRILARSESLNRVFLF